MKTLLAFLLLSQSGSAAQSPFDDTWIIDSESTQLPQKPAVYLLAKGKFDWSGRQIRADGHDQKVPETGYSDTVSVRIVDWIEIPIEFSVTFRQAESLKRDAKIVGVLRLTVAPDGKTIRGTYENKENNTTTRSEMRKQE